MGLAEEMSGIDTVMPDQADQRRAVPFPVGVAQFIGIFLAEVQQPGDIAGHRTVDVREDVRAGIVQRVVEIENPDPRFAGTGNFHVNCQRAGR